MLSSGMMLRVGSKSPENLRSLEVSTAAVRMVHENGTGKQQLLTLKAAAATSPTLNGSSRRAGMISYLRHPMHSRSVNLV